MSENKSPKVQIETPVGDILLELYPQQAPITVQNFLHYIEEDRFREATFHRIVRMDNQPNNEFKIEVIQGGLKEDEHPLNLPPIPHETTQQTGIRHTNGVISMARNEPGSAQSDFFICIGDQPELDFGGRRNPDGQGFAAFGRVIEGMEVVHQIHASPAEGQNLKPKIAIQRIRIVE
jgi:peptidyl-prolyl cis-trans isomerase A (cyclophilin A)